MFSLRNKKDISSFWMKKISVAMLGEFWIAIDTDSSCGPRRMISSEDKQDDLNLPWVHSGRYAFSS